MTTKDAIIIFHHYSKQDAAQALNTQKLLLESCNKGGFTIIKTFECDFDNYLQHDKIRSFLIKQPSKLAVIINSLEIDDYLYYGIYHILGTLSTIGIIDLYIMDAKGNLYKGKDDKNNE